jgi:hypothetical protein
MVRLAAVALSCGLLVVASGCGGDEGYTATSPDAADLRVTLIWDESGGLYAEGARSFVAVESRDGDRLLETELQPTARGHEAAIRLDPGEYRVVSWQRPCDGSCDTLDPPTDRCVETFVLRGETSVSARIDVRAGEGCTIAFE